ncbi:MAG: hypothetical protein H6753_03285 [Candidatus Omnitrophica bacterium]|nr:hypothetical protein [Candidatus Omnitrophota bacterium]
MKKFNLILLMLLFTLSGCTFYGVDAQEIVMAPLGQNKPAASEIQYLETVTVPYEVIGHVTVNTERRNSMEEVIEKMKRQVSVLGADAITNIVQTDKPSSITRIRTVYTGTVIVFK